MKTCLGFVLACALSVLSTNALPAGYGFGRRPERSSYLQGPNPHEAMMFSGFYGNGQGQPFGNRGAMAAFANKDMVFTNSFAGEELPLYYQQEQPAATTGTEQGTGIQAETASSFEEELDAPQEEVATTRRPLKPKNKNGKKKPTTPATPIEEVDSDEEDDESPQSPQIPFRGRGSAGNAGNPTNTFFPVLFGHGAGGKNGGAGTPGAAVAIANAFSTGKGGVATSHATAYGDPYFSRNKGNKSSQ